MTEPERWPGEHAQLARIVARKEENERIFREGTPEEKKRRTDEIVQTGVEFIMDPTVGGP